MPGDVALVRSLGICGDLIRVGDAIKCARLGLAYEPFSHAAIYVGGGKCVEAWPRGARLRDVSAYKHVSWRRPQWRAARDAYAGGCVTSHRSRQLAASAAVRLLGTPYSWLDIAALTLADLGWNVQQRDGTLTRVGRRIASNKTLVCSALVVLAWARAGVTLLPGRLPGEVTPGDLARCPLLHAA